MIELLEYLLNESRGIFDIPVSDKIEYKNAKILIKQLNKDKFWATIRNKAGVRAVVGDNFRTKEEAIEAGKKLIDSFK